MPTVAPIIDNDYLLTFCVVVLRFIVVAVVSLVSLVIAKKVLLFINKDINTRKFFGV